jgi:hypothetical protein
MPAIPQCKFRAPRPRQAALCLLNLYGGKVTDGTCRRCIRLGQNNPQYAAELFARAERTHPSNRPRLSGCCDRADQA